MPRDIERGKVAGLDDYITKPLDIQNFWIKLIIFLLKMRFILDLGDENLGLLVWFLTYSQFIEQAGKNIFKNKKNYNQISDCVCRQMKGLHHK